MTLNAETVDVAIVGGGVAGLAAGVTAARHGASAVVLEAASEAGGLVRSIRRAGYTFDCSGHVLHLSHETARTLIASVTDDAAWHTHVRRAFVWVRDRLVPYPFQLHLAHAPPDVRRDCLAGLPSRDAVPRSPSTSFAAWIDAALGSGIGRHFMVPYNEKVATVSVSELTCEWLGRFVPVPSVDDVRAGAVDARVANGGYNRTFRYPRAGGIDLVPRALARRVDRLRTNAEVVAIDTDRRRVRLRNGETIGYRVGVIASVPLPAMRTLVVPAAPALDAAARLRASSVTCVNLGVRSLAPAFRDLHWVYLPERRFRAYRVGVYDGFAATMTPPGRHGLYVEIAHGPDAIEADLVRAAIADVVALGMVAGDSAVEVVVPVRIPRAYVIHDHAWAPARSVLHEALAARNVWMVGRYGRWEYASIEDALVQGVEVCEHALAGPEGRLP